MKVKIHKGCKKIIKFLLPECGSCGRISVIRSKRTLFSFRCSKCGKKTLCRRQKPLPFTGAFNPFKL